MSAAVVDVLAPFIGAGIGALLGLLLAWRTS